MLIVGLTGGVASGKNFVASQFKRLKIPVFDADLEVHKLLASDKEIFLQVKQNFPKAIIDGKIDRVILGEEVLGDKNKLQNMEQIIYPQLRKKENLFIKNCRARRQKIAILNIPLLFEKGGYKRCHKTIAVIVSPAMQLHRFKNRQKSPQKSPQKSHQKNFKPKEMDSELIYKKFKNITAHQINNLQRKSRADFLIYNGLSKGFTMEQVKNLPFVKIGSTNFRSNYVVAN